MADPVTSYPVDYTGQAASNRITGEQVVVLPAGDRLFHFSMLQFGPFFEEGLNLRLRDLNNNVTPLVNGVDYYLSHKFMDASLATMHPLWGSISWLKDISGTLLADYNTLGGIWTISADQIATILMNTTQNPRITTWEQVVERPVDFPVIDHPWDLDDMVGQSEILDVLNNFYTAYLASLDPNGGGGGSSIILDHINNLNNPHKTTAVQVGAYSTIQIDTMLGGYVTSTGTAANSTAFNGKTYAQMLQDVVATKVTNAANADNATNAANATLAANSTAFNGKSYAQMLQDVVGTKVTNAANADNATNSANATKASNSDALGGQSLAQVLAAAQQQQAADSAKFNGKTYADVTADILTGTAANSTMLGGQTLQQIITSLQQSTGDAATLNGKSYADIMNAVQTTKVDNATHADSADNATSLGGQSLSQVLAQVAGVVPDNAKNAAAVYGYTFDQLVAAIAQSQTWSDELDYLCVDVDVENATLQHPNDGGTADAAYKYLFVGSFPIPTTGASNEFYDPTVEVIGSSMDMMFFFGTNTVRARLDITYNADQTMTFGLYSDFGDLTNLVYFGARSVDSALKSSDGTKTGKTNEVYVKFATAQNLKRVGIFQYTKNDFVLDESEEVNLYDSTYSALNTTTWHSASNTAWGNSLIENINDETSARTLADSAIRTDMQTAFDTLADDITALLATPAA